MSAPPAAVAAPTLAVVAKGKEKVDASMPPPAPSSGRFVAYPARVAEHADVVADVALFRAALEKLHAHMGTRLK
jgi:hypothetical protein